MSYTIEFPTWETGTWVQEKVEILGLSTPEPKTLAILSTDPWQLAADAKAKSPDGKTASLRRSTERLIFGPDVLDEDPDTLSFSYIAEYDIGMVEVERNLDRIQARVTVTPCVPSGGSDESEVKEGHYGP